MRFRVAFVCVVWFLFAGITSAQYATYKDLHSALALVTLDTLGPWSVDGFFFEDGPVTMVLDSGTVWRYQQVQGRTIGAVFKGRGTLTYTPNLPVEQLNLSRFYPERVYTQNIETVSVFFTAESMQDLFSGEKTKGALPSALAKTVATTYRDMVLNGGEESVDDAISRCLFNGYDGGMTYIVTHGQQQSWNSMVLIDHAQPEPYRLYVAKKGDDFTWTNSCPPNDGFKPLQDWGGVVGDLVHLAQHTMMATFTGLSLTVHDRIDVVAKADSVQWFDVGLYPKLTVDSIRVRGGERLHFFQSKQSGTIWIRLPDIIKSEQSVTLDMYFHGDIVRRHMDYTSLESSIGWYPSHGYKQLSYFDITFNHEKRYNLVGVGDLTSKSEKDGIVTQRWVSGRLIRNASFHIGVFKTEVLPTVEGIPTASMLYVTREQADVVGQDIAQSLEFFTKLYGDLPIKHLNATEQPGLHGEAFPGLLHLSSYAFLRSLDFNKNDDFFGEQFTSHEVAHQWWGIAVDFTSYRDQWISEGFAMYSCLLYSQLAAKDRDKFLYLLNDYKKQILRRGKKTIGKTQPQPMISLGYRARVGGAGSDHNLYVYYKPAWVLHMLRNMMINLKTMDEAPFMNAMKEFYTTYRTKHATTEDFRRVMEKHAGIDLAWFFDQWIHGNQIPFYTFAWTKKKRDDGNWVISCRVKQDNVDPEFAMYVPIKIVTKQGGLRLRAIITGAESTFDLPAINDEPTEVTFNDLESVLCTVDTETF